MNREDIETRVIPFGSRLSELGTGKNAERVNSNNQGPKEPDGKRRLWFSSLFFKLISGFLS